MPKLTLSVDEKVVRARAQRTYRPGLPVSSALVEAGPDETRRPLTREHYIRGSVSRVRVDNTTPLGYGFEPDFSSMGSITGRQWRGGCSRPL